MFIASEEILFQSIVITILTNLLVLVKMEDQSIAEKKGSVKTLSQQEENSQNLDGVFLIILT